MTGSPEIDRGFARAGASIPARLKLPDEPNPGGGRHPLEAWISKPLAATDRSQFQPVEANLDQSKPISTDQSQFRPIEANSRLDQTPYCPEMGPIGGRHCGTNPISVWVAGALPQILWF
jgi:hypothetical protein